MKLRKTVSILLAALLVCMLCAPGLAAEGDSLTRGEFVSALYERSGITGMEPKQAWFEDVEMHGELALAVRWAVLEGIAKGYGDSRFGPDDPITREQMATMLYRYAQALGRGFEGAWYFPLDYPDAAEISDWADEAMHWCVMQGILTGTDRGLEPEATATDDQLALVLERWEAGVNSDAPAGIDYLALVNKRNALPEGWEDALDTVTITNSVGDEVEVEARAYEAYEKLAADLEENDGIYLELDSARRSVAAQQDIMDRFTEKYGADYAAKTVAQPGYSEHHTGLALDLYFKLKNDDGTFTDVYYNEDMVQYPEVWAAIHAKLADYGFILRYPEGREHITGYGYEPWHIRYLDDPDIAAGITDAGLTLEEYLAGEKAPEVAIDYGASAFYTKEDLDEAIVQIKCRFAAFGCELHSLTYAGDEANNAENLAWTNELDEGKGYTQVCEFLSDFHTPADAGGAWEADREYTDWQWWLARTDDGGWQLLTWGY